MATPKINWKIFTCIKIHQTFSLPKPWRQHSTSTSTMVGCHSIYLLSITINTKEPTGIKITQSSRLLSIKISSSTGNSSKVRHSREKISRTLNIHPGSPCQICYYSFINRTKIKCQIYHLHEYCQHIWHSCFYYIFHE